MRFFPTLLNPLGRRPSATSRPCTWRRRRGAGRPSGRSPRRIARGFISCEAAISFSKSPDLVHRRPPAAARRRAPTHGAVAGAHHSTTHGGFEKKGVFLLEEGP